MKGKMILVICCVACIALFVCFGIFFGHNSGKVEALYNEAITALDNESGLEELFQPQVKEKSKTLKEDIDAINNFYVGKSAEVKDYKFYRSTNTEYIMYATVKTDGGEYFVCATASGARMVDSYGIKQLIIEDSQEFKHKKLFKKGEFGKYIDHAKDYGVTIRVKGDKK